MNMKCARCGRVSGTKVSGTGREMAIDRRVGLEGQLECESQQLGGRGRRATLARSRCRIVERGEHIRSRRPGAERGVAGTFLGADDDVGELRVNVPTGHAVTRLVRRRADEWVREVNAPTVESSHAGGLGLLQTVGQLSNSQLLDAGLDGSGHSGQRYARR